jgi:hypothetical protein
MARQGNCSVVEPARAGADGTSANDPSVNPDVAIDAEARAVDRKLKGICRGC